jgi:hypothetical protein
MLGDRFGAAGGGNRSIHQMGKRELIRGGVSLGRSREDFAYGLMLTNRFVIGGCKALLLGTVASQIAFAPELRTYNEQLVAAANAPVVAAHQRLHDDDLKTAAAEARRDADTEREIAGQTSRLRQRDLANSRSVGRRGANERRQLTQQQLQVYETREAAANEKAARSAQAYQVAQPT